MRRRKKILTPDKKLKRFYCVGDEIEYFDENGIVGRGDIILITYGCDKRTEENLDYLIADNWGYTDEIKRENILNKYPK